MFISILIGMLAIINPFSTIPAWISLTHDYDNEFRKETLRKTIKTAVVLFVIVLFAGKAVLMFFGLSLPAIKLAGALMIVLAALKLEVSKPVKGAKITRKTVENHREDISFSPMAMPLIIGPGCIAVILTYLEEYGSLFHTLQPTLYIMISGFIALALTWVLLRNSDKIMTKLGYGGIVAVSRLNGFILLCIGAQFLVSAIRDIINLI